MFVRARAFLGTILVFLVKAGHTFLERNYLVL